MLSATAESSSRMAKKRPLAPPASPTDEWGIYDPAKAGMQALYSRLGRPILRASAASERRERRRAFRPSGPPTASAWPCRKRNAAPNLLVDAATAKAAAPAPPEPVRRGSRTAAAARRHRLHRRPAPRAPRPPRARSARHRRRDRRRRTGADDRQSPRQSNAPAPAPTAAVAAPVNAPAAAPMDAPAPRRGRKPAAHAAVVRRPRRLRSPPPHRRRPPSRRPRRGVRADRCRWPPGPTRCTTRPGDEPKRGEAKGLWRGIFRIPSEVALVEYGRGCRIHRVVIETAADALVDPSETGFCRSAYVAA